MARKKRILIISDSIKRKTGYATVARNIIKRLIATGKYEIAQLGLADVPAQLELPITYYSGLKVHEKCCKRGKVIEYREKNNSEIKYLVMTPDMPLHENQHPCIKGIPDGNDNYGYISVYFVVQHFKPDIVMPINDIWGLYNLVHLRNRRCFKFVPYTAIDSECMFPQLAIPNPQVPLPPVDPILTIENADYPVVFTNWAQKVLNETTVRVGKEPFTKMLTIPHGVDTKIWKPLDNKDELRKKYFSLPNNAFLVGSVARNQPRKRLDALLQAAKVYIDKYEKDRKLYVYFHCALEDRLGWPIPWLANYYGILDRCIFDKNLKPGVGPTDEQMNELVNCFDVHVSLTNSEGWHLPALETLAAGIPNILTNYSAHADWGKGTIILCKVAATEHEPRTGFVKAIADINDCAKQLKLLSTSPKFHEEWSAKGVKLGKKLDWDNVAKMWEDLFDSIDISDLDEGRYSEPFVSNPAAQDFNLKFFPKEEDKYDPTIREQVR